MDGQIVSPGVRPLPWHRKCAVKVMSNYTNSIAGTPLDPQPEPYRWSKPRIPMRPATV